MSEKTTILIGTAKGAFLLASDERRLEWSLTGPYCDGWPVNHVVGDSDTGTIWAAGGGEWDGAGIWRSENGGKTWTLAKLSAGQRDEWAKKDPEAAEFFGWDSAEAPFTGEIDAIWSLRKAHGAVYAGAKPASLFKSMDGGENWRKIDGLTDHPSRESWNPGGAGLVLHTIVDDPEDADKLWVAISSAGVFATEDGGTTWDRRNRLSNAEACEHDCHPAAPRGGETGHCVHSMHRAPGSGDLLYQQNHHGVWRSNDGGRTWQDINAGLPSTFGFPIAVHPRDPETIWVVPLNGDSDGRYPPNASAAVWKSDDGGGTWRAKRAGLPEKDCYFTVLRQAMAVDDNDCAGIYFGTNSGSVFSSIDEGENWTEIARHLPTILSVETLQRPA